MSGIWKAYKIHCLLQIFKTRRAKRRNACVSRPKSEKLLPVISTHTELCHTELVHTAWGKPRQSESCKNEVAPTIRKRKKKCLDMSLSLPRELAKICPWQEKQQKHRTLLFISPASQMCWRVCFIWPAFRYWSVLLNESPLHIYLTN